jgi:hypothetical protein
MKDARLGTFSPEEHSACCTRNDGRTDFEWKSDCGWLALLEDGDGWTICCGGFYDPWYGTREAAIALLDSTVTADNDD